MIGTSRIRSKRRGCEHAAGGVQAGQTTRVCTRTPLRRFNALTKKALNEERKNRRKYYYIGVSSKYKEWRVCVQLHLVAW